MITYFNLPIWVCLCEDVHFWSKSNITLLCFSCSCFFFLLFQYKYIKKQFYYLYTLTILYILYAVPDNSSSLSVTQARPKAGHPWLRGLEVVMVRQTQCFFVISKHLWETSVLETDFGPSGKWVNYGYITSTLKYLWHPSSSS